MHACRFPTAGTCAFFEALGAECAAAAGPGASQRAGASPSPTANGAAAPAVPAAAAAAPASGSSAGEGRGAAASDAAGSDKAAGREAGGAVAGCSGAAAGDAAGSAGAAPAGAAAAGGGSSAAAPATADGEDTQPAAVTPRRGAKRGRQSAGVHFRSLKTMRDHIVINMWLAHWGVNVHICHMCQPSHNILPVYIATRSPASCGAAVLHKVWTGAYVTKTA